MLRSGVGDGVAVAVIVAVGRGVGEVGASAVTPAGIVAVSFATGVAGDGRPVLISGGRRVAWGVSPTSAITTGGEFDTPPAQASNRSNEASKAREPNQRPHRIKFRIMSVREPA